MKIQIGHEVYWTTYIDDAKAGFAGFDLHREAFGKTALAAKIIYWDAAGRFTIETFGSGLLVEVADAAIAEAKAKIRIS
jgi:hypothetical protein